MKFQVKEEVKMVKAIIGLQFGDEGKGAVVERAAKEADVDIRYNGGSNAGHTVVNEYGTTIFHQVPSAIFDDNTLCIIGNGCVVDPSSLVKEIKGLNSKGIETQGRLFVGLLAHVVTPWHTKAESGGIADKVDTTRKGIGPCYSDKYARVGIRMECFQDEKILKEALDQAYRGTGRFEEICEKVKIQEEWLSLRKFLLPYIKEVRPMIWQACDDGKNIILEGAQGYLLDIDGGTYPYCTSSHCGIGGIYQGSGIPATTSIEAIGIAKAYITRVGNGPFPTQINGELEENLRKKGKEFGATTGRPRKCGWLDLPLLRYACKANGIHKLIITKLDVLDELDKIQLCLEYREGRVPEVFPSDSQSVTPVYAEMPGWKKPLSCCHSYQMLPDETKLYLQRIEENVGVRISGVSVGPGTDQFIEF
jgi:adenylosuccinate synthase